MEDAFAIAMEAVRGRARPGAEVPDEVLALARRVVEAGRRVTAAPLCPAALLARARRVPEEHPRTAVVEVLRLLFDSFTALAPATRGGVRSRFLRYGGGAGHVDVELATSPEGDVRVRGTVDGVDGDLALDVLGRRGAKVTVPVRAGGAFAVTVPAGRAPFTMTVRAGRRALFRTGRIPPVGGR